MTCPDCGGFVEFSTLLDPAGGASMLIWDCARCQCTRFMPEPVTVVEWADAG